jgi:hypothetical protein
MRQALLLCFLTASAATLAAQTAPVTVLEIDMENAVTYAEDATEMLK